ncbi:hypothetical protein ACFQD0_12545 [Sulfitobacter aestuariivivens]|uniref:Uncharacterized protein n=1 Tax=Sulfitobacter aestuariivivens TaxID=2766981 RepID=A0A927D197_9RHOB|nr:hypothetical protein [Sulfitobacter aestuariivivens]MBD3663228.1 hypothetical protein [Sulfitobacter aestuariivivens]
MKHDIISLDARHARMFELLRQSHQAEITSTRLAQPRLSEPNSHDLVQALKRDAIASLRVPRPHSAIASTFRLRSRRPTS